MFLMVIGGIGFYNVFSRVFIKKNSSVRKLTGLCAGVCISRFLCFVIFSFFILVLPKCGDWKLIMDSSFTLKYK